MTDRPIRIQLSRAKGWKMPENTVKVDRSTKWGNPWRTGSPGCLGLREMPSDYRLPLPVDQKSAVNAYRIWLTKKPEWWMIPSDHMFTTRGWEAFWAAFNSQQQAVLMRLHQLRGKNLACWCKPGDPCHADVLLELANGGDA